MTDAGLLEQAYRPSGMEEFLRELYRPVLSMENAKRRYVCVRGSYASALKGDGGFIESEWGTLEPSEFSSWIRKVKERTTRLPHCFNLTVAPRIKADAKKQFTAGVSALWCDVDGALCGEWIPMRLPKLFNTPLRPSAIVDSGWGTHLYWFLSSFVSFAGDEPLSVRDEVSFCNAFLAWYLGGDGQTSSADHLMRLPGSSNCKTYPYRGTKIWLLKDEWAKRYDYRGMRKTIYQYKDRYESWFQKKIREGRDYSKELSELRGLRKYSESGNAEARVPYPGRGDKISEDAGRIYELLEGSRDGCPILGCAFSRPHELRYFEWISIGSALAQIYSDDTGYEVFRRLSLPGNTSGNPEDEIRNCYENLARRGFMPYGCAKLSEAAGCPRLETGRCKSLLSCIRRICKAWSAQ